ncbi:hypothetical protein AaE_015905 [Aphanomyces astaci]|uniref:Myb/SANT-like domain-containing protein n=1 Tax=Aphanomyces astaci TaxID=112090 RepID=A0A6A4YZR4_APHAT|nr:hypothetical protein AaE_015905 [Aphanomyces astaci]
MAASTKTKILTKKELIERLARLEAAGQVSNQESSSSPNVPLPDKKTLWTVDMVQVLLELRLRTYGPPFKGSKSNQQLSILWQKIAMRLSIVTGVVVSQTSAKAKYHSLKQEYSRSRVAEQATGNNADVGVEYPAYWEHMVGGDGMENAMVANDGDSWAEPVIVAADDRPSKRQKPGSSSVANGLISLGETLAKGLVDAATVSGGNASTMQKLDLLVESVDESKKIHAALLESIVNNNAIHREFLDHLRGINRP